uniref:Ceramide synthase 5 n=1 Tax=Rousettus aegyptiacus TaxID=9407 RepID=A0A7J8JBC5_ROUAE|nr:ceramide synthase 5 [Rousettus aegyptiacus]
MATAAAGSLGLLWGWLWSERFWMPQNVSWADLEGPGDGYGYPRARHILSVFPLAAGIFSVRLLFERILMRKGWRACQSNWTGTSEKSNAGFAIGGIRTNPQRSLNSVKACGDSLFIYVYFATELDFSGRHLGFGTPDSAGIAIHISLSQVGFITIISWNWPSIGLLCFLSLQTLKERTS